MTPENGITDQYGKSSFARFALAHAAMASLFFAVLLFKFVTAKQYQYLILAVSALQFALAQFFALRLSARKKRQATSTWVVVGSLSLAILLMPLVLENAIFIGLGFLAAIPLFVGVTNQLRLLPAALFVTFVASALTILVDLVFPWPEFRLHIATKPLLLASALGTLAYLSCLLIIFYGQNQHLHRPARFRINLATQYALVIGGISAMVIVLVSSVLITQIRKAQIDQVGKNFETIAKNYAKLAGSHLEQQMQKLQLLTQQVPIIKESLIQADGQYMGDRRAAHQLLEEKNRLWQWPIKNNVFMMNYLNSPVIEALSRFRGHNSFHNDIIIVDGYGGLVASLGQKPEQFYFYDQRWWQVAWNGGLGNIFIGDLVMDSRTDFPKLRIAVDIIDHSTNKVIGILSSMYLLRTLIEDVQRFMPETVDQISLIDENGNIITSSDGEISNKQTWPQLRELTTHADKPDSGWNLGRDHLDQAALIGFSSLSTAYNVISDPLHRLGWHIVVSGSRFNALSGVNKSTKMAMIVGLAAMALGVLGAIAAARVITRPIENLTATASAMSEGDLEKRAEPAGPEELVALSVGFNGLTSQLHQVITDLKTQTAQLAKAKSEAEAATKLKGEFLANMSHEIRTPLNAILGFATILESLLEDDKKRGYAHTIRTSGSDLLHLINDILDLSKIEAGRMEIQLQAVDIRQLFTELKRIFSISAEEKGISLEMDVASEVPGLLMLDNIRLKQVLFNLIGNAVKCTEHGGVFCSAATSSNEITNTQDLTITVRDTGIGIDPAHFNNIFEIFQQYNNDNPSKGIEGTGLGLTISKSLVEMMGGTIRVDGKPGDGATFSIFIPEVILADISSSEDQKAFTQQAGDRMLSLGPADILIVDDLEINRHLLSEKLKPYPLKIFEAEGGQAAVRMAKEGRYDLILMDIRMPDMDGYTALKEIRSISHAIDTPVIAITAAAMKEDISKITQAGFNDFLIRPFHQVELVELLARYLPHTSEKDEKSAALSSPLATFINKNAGEWSCPPGAEEYIQKTLNTEWEKVAEKQSIPEILRFAENVGQAGEQYRISILSQYSSELTKSADAFDIENVEKLLGVFDDILSCRKVEEA